MPRLSASKNTTANYHPSRQLNRGRPQLTAGTGRPAAATTRAGFTRTALKIPAATMRPRRRTYWSMSSPALAVLESTAIGHRVITHGRAANLAEAARARGVEPADVVKTTVVRRGADDYLFVLVPGDRATSWPKLRTLLGRRRLSMPDAATARQVTGYERGTITPLGASTAWPVLAEARLRRRQITLGAGEHGVALAVSADEVLRQLGAQLADITRPTRRGHRVAGALYRAADHGLPGFSGERLSRLPPRY